MQGQTPVIETHQLTKRYGEKIAVNHLDLTVGRQQIFAFLGENGSGKTTTMRLLLGLQHATDGEARLFGQRLTENRSPILAKIGTLIEMPSYYGHLSGQENMEIVRLLRNAPSSQIAELLRLVGLQDAVRQKVRTYSLGMKQRLAMAMALVGSPELLMLDEPTNGLDPSGIREFREFIKSLPQRFGITVFVSSHLLSEVEAMATHTAIIHKGSLLFQGSLEQLRARAQPQIVLRTKNNVTAFAVLQASRFPSQLYEHHIAIYAPDETIPSINQYLVQAGVAVTHLAGETATLEDLFFALTQKGR